MNDPGKVQIRVNLTLMKRFGSPRIQCQICLLKILGFLDLVINLWVSD